MEKFNYICRYYVINSILTCDYENIENSFCFTHCNSLVK